MSQVLLESSDECHTSPYRYVLYILVPKDISILLISYMIYPYRSQISILIRIKTIGIKKSIRGFLLAYLVIAQRKN